MKKLLLTTAIMLLWSTCSMAQFGSSRPGSGGLGTPGGFGNSSLSGGIGNSQGSPAFSPYLNLTRGGNSAATNLYGIVRPQQAFSGALQSLQQQFNLGQNSGDDQGNSGVVVGTKARFLNTGGYFQNMNGGTTTSSSLGNATSVLGGNRPSQATLGGAGNSNLRGGFGNTNGSFGQPSSGGSGTRPR